MAQEECGRIPEPVCPERLDPDQVCPERLDPDPVNIRPDPQPCTKRKKIFRAEKFHYTILIAILMYVLRMIIRNDF